MKERILIFLRGVAMGGADIIPGVSGGTIAFITGIYERLIASIQAIDLKALELLKKGKIKRLWIKIDGPFLATLFAGIILSIWSLARLLSHLLLTYPIQLWSFFFGLIVISAIVIAKNIRRWNLGKGVSLVLGVVVAYLITVATPAQTPEALWFVFISGAIAICAMILPGISGSFILLILGKYEYVLTAVKDFDILVILVFMIGCLIGILAFSRLIGWLLDRYHDITIALLAGFMLGSLNKIWPWKKAVAFRLNSAGEQVPLLEENLLPARYLQETGSEPYVLQALMFMALGLMVVIAIEWGSRRLGQPGERYA